MQILTYTAGEVAAVELWQMPPCSTFVPEFQVKELGIPLGSADLWYLSNQSDEYNFTVVNLNTGSVFSFGRGTKVIPVPSILQRA